MKKTTMSLGYDQAKYHYNVTGGIISIKTYFYSLILIFYRNFNINFKIQY